MANVNNRIKKPQALTVNGIDAGGMMSANINCGYDNVLKTPADGLSVPLKDKEIQFCRGSMVTQDWVHAIGLLTGAVGTAVFYERESGAATYTKHTITNPVIHNMSLSTNKGGYAQVSFDFECKAADETKGFTDMWAIESGQTAPTDVTAARGGFRVESCKHDPDGVSEIVIYHIMGLNFSISMPLTRACNDTDVGYTAVDAETDAMQIAGSLNFQDASVSTSVMAQQLLAASAADLELQLTQSQGATDKVLTIANVDFNTVGESPDVGSAFSGFTANFDIANAADTPLTLDGDNKIMTIEDYVA